MKILLNVTEKELQQVSGDMAFYRDLLMSDDDPGYGYQTVGSGMDLPRHLLKAPEKIARAMAGGSIRNQLFNLSRLRPVGDCSDCDLILTHICYSHLEKPDIPVIWSTQGLSPPGYYDRAGPVAYEAVVDFYREMVDRVDEFLIWTDSGAVRLRHELGEDVPITVLPPVLPRRQSIATRADSEEVRVLFVGRDAARKGLYELLEACGRLGQSVAGNTWSIDLVTAPEPQILAAAGALPDARCHSGLDDGAVTDLMVQADLLVLPTLAETYGYVLIEAMARGCALVTTDSPPMNELVTEGYNGRVVNPGSVDHIHEVLVDLIGNRDRVEQMGAASLARYESTFTPEVVLPGYHRLFQRVVSSHA